MEALLRKTFIILLSLLLIGLLFYTAIQERTVIVIEDQTSGELKTYVTNDRTFILSYVHSVLLTPVEEYFSIDENDLLILQKTVYESFGVGLPYEQIEDSDFEIIDDKFILYIERSFKSIHMIISVIPDHTLTIDGEVIDLSKVFGNGTQLLEIYSEKKMIFRLGNYQYVL